MNDGQREDLLVVAVLVGFGWLALAIVVVGWALSR